MPVKFQERKGGIEVIPVNRDIGVYTLKNTQARIFQILHDNEGVMVRREDIIKEIWGDTYPINASSLTLLKTHYNKVRNFIIDMELPYDVFNVHSTFSGISGFIFKKEQNN